MSIVFRRAFVLSAHRRSLLRNNTPAHSRTFATIMADWVHVPATGAGDSLVSSYSIFTKPIEKSQQDDRDYRLIRLENGLEALLVHDAKADKAAASLDVSVGHLADPVRPILNTSTVHLFQTRTTCLGWPISANICYSWCAT